MKYLLAIMLLLCGMKSFAVEKRWRKVPAYTLEYRMIFESRQGLKKKLEAFETSIMKADPRYEKIRIRVYAATKTYGHKVCSMGEFVERFFSSGIVSTYGDQYALKLENYLLKVYPPQKMKIPHKGV